MTYKQHSLRGFKPLMEQPWAEVSSGSSPKRRATAILRSRGTKDSYRPRGQHRLTIERAIERDEIPRNSDVDVLMDMLYGPAYHRLLNGHLPFNERSVQEVVEVIVAGAKSRSAASS